MNRFTLLASLVSLAACLIHAKYGCSRQTRDAKRRSAGSAATISGIGAPASDCDAALHSCAKRGSNSACSLASAFGSNGHAAAGFERFVEPGTVRPRVHHDIQDCSAVCHPAASSAQGSSAKGFVSFIGQA